MLPVDSRGERKYIGSMFTLAPLSVTGIGSVPYQDPKEAVGLILEHLKEMPFWPQLVRRGFREEMVGRKKPIERPSVMVFIQDIRYPFGQSAFLLWPDAHINFLAKWFELFVYVLPLGFPMVVKQPLVLSHPAALAAGEHQTINLGC